MLFLIKIMVRYGLDVWQIWYELDNVEGLQVGSEAVMEVDKEVRARHAKLHSAGHLIDLAVQKLGTLINNDRIRVGDCERISLPRWPIRIIQRRELKPVIKNNPPQQLTEENNLILHSDSPITLQLRRSSGKEPHSKIVQDTSNQNNKIRRKQLSMRRHPYREHKLNQKIINQQIAKKREISTCKLYSIVISLYILNKFGLFNRQFQ